MKLASMHPMFQFFNRLLRSLFTQFYLENPRSDIVVLAKSKLQSMSSQSCRVKIAGVIEIWKCLLECQDWSPSLFLSTNCSHCILWHAIFGEAFTMKGGNFAEHILVKCPPPKKILMAKMAFGRRWGLEYWTLPEANEPQREKTQISKGVEMDDKPGINACK